MKEETGKVGVVPIDEMIGFVDSEVGVILALSGDGMEVLFASKENAPLRWVKIGEFTPDPRGIPSAEEVEGAEEPPPEED